MDNVNVHRNKRRLMNILSISIPLITASLPLTINLPCVLLSVRLDNLWCEPEANPRLAHEFVSHLDSNFCHNLSIPLYSVSFTVESVARVGLARRRKKFSTIAENFSKEG